MSERQAKKNRKTVDQTPVKGPKNKASILMNVIIWVVVVAVLGLGVYAVGSKYIAKYQEQKAQEVQTITVADVMAEEGITLEEFKTEYGLEADEEVTEESDMNMVASKFTLTNYAKYTGVTIEELRAQYGLGDNVADTTIWADAMPYMTTGVVAQNFFNVDFETLKTQLGFPEEITEDTLWSETDAIMSALYAEQQAAAAETETDETSETESAGE